MNAAIIIGRFNPPTTAHGVLIQHLLSIPNVKHFIFIIDGEKSSLNKDKNPLSGEYRRTLLSGLYPNAAIDVASSPIEVFDILEVQGYVLSDWIMGSDRIDSYRKLIEYVQYDVNLISIDRTNSPIKNVSATCARRAARCGDSILFKQYLHKMDDNIAEDVMKLIERSGA